MLCWLTRTQNFPCSWSWYQDPCSHLWHIMVRVVLQQKHVNFPIAIPALHRRGCGTGFLLGTGRSPCRRPRQCLSSLGRQAAFYSWWVLQQHFCLLSCHMHQARKEGIQAHIHVKPPSFHCFMFAEAQSQAFSQGNGKKYNRLIFQEMSWSFTNSKTCVRTPSQA